MSYDDMQQVTEGTRTIHVYAPFTQNVIRTCQQWNPKAPISNFAFGAVRHRRREEAIAIQFMNIDFCQRNQITCLAKFFDVRNAFYCVQCEQTRQCMSECPAPFRYFLAQVVENHCAVIACSDGVIISNPESGVAPGLACATDYFNQTYDRVLKDYNGSTKVRQRPVVTGQV